MTKHTDTYNTKRGFRQVCLSLKVPLIFLTKKSCFFVVFYLNSCFLDLLLLHSWLEMVKTVLSDFQFSILSLSRTPVEKQPASTRTQHLLTTFRMLTSLTEKSSFNP